MNYLSLNTGRLLYWGRERLQPETETLLKPTLVHPIARIPGPLVDYTRRIAISADGAPPSGKPTGGAMIIVSIGELVCAVYGLADSRRGADQIWAALKKQAESEIEGQPSGIVMPPQPPLPWLCALLLPPVIKIPVEDLPKLADYAACMATLMLEARRKKP